MQISYSKQKIDANDIKAVVKVLQSDFLTQGPLVRKFEDSLKKYCNSKYAVSLSSASSALYAACKALDLKENDILWTSPNTFVASANCALLCGAKVDFVDIDPKTYNMCADELEQKLYKASKINALPKVVMPVHFAGQPCNMKRIYDLSKKYKFRIIEDASHAIGSSYKKHKIGSCKYSDISVFSFHPVKIITTGEGGACLTNNPELANKIFNFRNHGVTRDIKQMNKKNIGPWYYEQIDIGYNFRLNDISCALGISQLKKLDKIIIKRQKMYNYYNDLCKGNKIKIPFQNKDIKSSNHLYVVRIKEKNLKKSKKDVFEYFKKNNIILNVHYIPVHYHPYYVKLGFKKGSFPNSEKYYQEAFTLPLYLGIKKDDQKKVINNFKKLLR